MDAFFTQRLPTPYISVFMWLNHDGLENMRSKYSERYLVELIKATIQYRQTLDPERFKPITYDRTQRRFKFVGKHDDDNYLDYAEELACEWCEILHL